jgi:hypothetical protein
MQSKMSSKMQIISYNIDDPDEPALSNANDQNVNIEDLQNTEGLVAASISQKSDIVDNYTTNNSKHDKMESFELQSD